MLKPLCHSHPHPTQGEAASTPAGCLLLPLSSAEWWATTLSRPPRLLVASQLAALAPLFVSSFFLPTSKQRGADTRELITTWDFPHGLPPLSGMFPLISHGFLSLVTSCA